MELRFGGRVSLFVFAFFYLQVMRKVTRAEMRAPVEQSARLGWAFRGLHPKTVSDYQRDMVRLLDWTGGTHVQDIKMDVFLGLMARLAPHYSSSRLEKFRASLAIHQVTLMEAQDRWSRDEAFKKAFDGLLVMCVPMVDRGPITRPKLVALVEYAVGLGEHLYAMGFQVGYNALLRHSDLIRLEEPHIDIRKDESNRVILMIVGGKNQAALGEGRPGIEYVDAPDTDLIFEHLIAQGAPGVPLFRGWNKHKANVLIKDFAKLAGWNLSLKWTFHSLRHGCATDMKLDGVSEETRKTRGRWKGRRVTEHYSRRDGQEADAGVPVRAPRKRQKAKPKRPRAQLDWG